MVDKEALINRRYFNALKTEVINYINKRENDLEEVMLKESSGFPNPLNTDQRRILVKISRYEFEDIQGFEFAKMVSIPLEFSPINRIEKRLKFYLKKKIHRTTNEVKKMAKMSSFSKVFCPNKLMMKHWIGEDNRLTVG